VPLAVVVLLGSLLAGSLALAIGIIVLARRKNPGR
jgi:hypothetical protein